MTSQLVSSRAPSAPPAMAATLMSTMPVEHAVPAQSPVVERQPGQDAGDREDVMRVEREGTDLGEDGGHVSGARDREGRPPNRHGPIIASRTTSRRWITGSTGARQ